MKVCPPIIRGTKLLLATAGTVAAAVMFAVPATANTVTYGPGTYAVPSQLPYGIYRASNAPGASPGCTYTTKTADGKVVDTNSGANPGGNSGANSGGNNGAFLGTVTVEVLSPIAQFTTSGCTPWVKVD